MEKSKKQRYLDIAASSPAFKPSEINILSEVIDDYIKKPDDDYIIIDEMIDNKEAGFVVFGSASLTDYAWDIYWLAVDKAYQRKGLGKKLIKSTVDYALKKADKAILRIEASGRATNEKVLAFYQALGFIEGGRIPDFYSDKDDLVIYYKNV